MQINLHDSLGDIAARVPQAAQVFESLRVDYCCNGARSLGDACADAGIAPGEVLARLAAAAQGSSRAVVDWSLAGPSRLIEHLLSTHHAYTRDSLHRLAALMSKVLAVHGEAHPELEAIAAALGALDADLMPHLMKEERVLFPYILEVEARRAEGRALGTAPFGTVRNPIQMMNREHEDVGRVLAELDARTSGYTAPEGACGSWRALYQGMKELQADLHQHIHLESNVLFPLAARLELGGAERV